VRCICIGAGVIGLLSAFTLARRGFQVTLLERQQAGREASWAGGGIVSPLYPWRYSREITALAHWSQDFYPQLSSELLDFTGIDPELHRTGLYWLDLDDEDVALAWAARERRPLHKVDIQQVYQAVPVAGRSFKRAIHLEGVANVRNPRLTRSLRAALLAMPNVELCENTEVTGFLRKGNAVVGVRTQNGELHADRVLVAAGAWSGELLSDLGLNVPVAPVRGQMILFKCAPDYLSSMVMANGRYAIPRRDGHVLVGSTLEHVGFDKRTTEEALQSLRASAAELIPALAEAEVAAHWAGLRPGSPDGVPYIGEVADYPGLWLNCGHYRNGLVLAPASCQLLADLMTGAVPAIDPAPYAPARRLAVAGQD
jgi:glycine oxidase